MRTYSIKYSIKNEKGKFGPFFFEIESKSMEDALRSLKTAEALAGNVVCSTTTTVAPNQKK